MDSPLTLNFKLYPQQDDFVRCRTRYVGFIGGVGTGKTLAGCVKALLKALNNPGSLGTIAAPTYPMLRDVTKRTFFEIVPPELIVYRNDSENLVGIRCADGRISEVLFRSASDPDSLRGPNLLWWYMDEASLSAFDAYQILMQRIRTGDPLEQQGWITTTPKGHNWVYDKFGEHVSDPEYQAFYAETKDNVFLPEQYINSVYTQFTGTFALQELKGRFVAAEGLVYGDLFDPQAHLGEHPFDSTLPVDLAWDFGFNNPEAVLAVQQDGRGNVFVIDELYHSRVLTEDIVAEAKSRPWFKNVVDCVCDDAAPSSIARLQNLRIPARPAKKGKVHEGITLVRNLLAKDRVTGRPILHVDRRCEHLKREFEAYRWAEKNTMTDQWLDRPVKAYDHCLDALRYWAVSKWTGVPMATVPVGFRPLKPKRRVMAYQFSGRRH